MNHKDCEQSTNFKVLKTVVIVLTLIFTLYPIIWLFLLSIKNPVQAFADPPVWFFKPDFSSYRTVFFENNFLQSYINSMIVTIGTMLLGFCIGVPAAYAFSRGRFRHKGKLLSIILISRMAPSLSFVIPFVIIFSRIGLSGSYFGLMLANQTFIMSLIVWLMKTYFDHVPSEIDESAEIDGAPALIIFLKVVLPLTTPGLLATLVLCFNTAWNEFMFALLLTRRMTRTAPVAILGFMGYEGLDWAQLATASVLVLLPVVIFAIAAQKYFVQSLTAGSVKE